METQPLDHIGKHLATGYLETAVFSHRFLEDHEYPPSLMSKVHYMRSAVQALVQRDDRLQLDPRYIESGRVLFTEIATGDQFVLRSIGAVHIEQIRAEKQLELSFAANLRPARSPVQILVYEFKRDGVELSLTDSVLRRGRSRLEAVGAPRYVGLWQYGEDDAERPFSQRGESAWDFLGDIGDIGDIDEPGASEG